MSQIFYNNVDAFSGQPTPIITRTPEPLFLGDGKRLGYVDRYSLNGQVTGCQYEEITGAMARINNVFSRDFYNLELRDTNFTGVISGIRIDNINYAQSSQVGVQEYNIDLISYPASFFENAGILDKRNEWSVTQNERGELSVTHTIFAKGFNTSASYDNAFINAKNFALQYTGLTPPPLFPFFMSGFSGSLDARSEVINRLEGTYQIEETYIASTGLNVVQDLNVSLESGTDGIISVDVNGSFRAGKGDSIDAARQKYSAFNAFHEASGVYVHYRGVTGLVAQTVSSGVTEDYRENALQFEISFNDWPTTTYRHIPSTQVSSGIDGIIVVSVNGRIEGLGRQKVRYDNAYNFYKTLDIYNVVNEAFVDYVGVGYPYPLNSYPIETGNTIDRFNGTIEYTATFNNKGKILDCSGIKFFDVNYAKRYAMRQIAPVSIPRSVSGLDVLDLDWNTRGTIEVNGTVSVDKPLTSIDATGLVRQFVNNKFRREILASGDKTKIKLESVNLSQNIDQNSCGFVVMYSFDEPLPINPDASYTLITGLNL